MKLDKIKLACGTSITDIDFPADLWEFNPDKPFDAVSKIYVTSFFIQSNREIYVSVKYDTHLAGYTTPINRVYSTEKSANAARGKILINMGNQLL